MLENPNGSVLSYLIGKTEGDGEDWHGHVTAITVSPYYRKLGFARSLMSHLERVSDERECFYVDLFVRVSNTLAIFMYENLNYVKFRRILQYYTGNPLEDAFDMRKALLADKERKSVVPMTRPIHADELRFN